DDIKEKDLPSEYHYENYAPGDKAAWIAIEKSAKEFTTDEAGDAAWSKYFAPYEKELGNRMFFVADSSGRKLATASAYFDIYTGDDGETGWLHWVAVHSDAQGKGLSKPLITHVLAHMKKLGYKRAVIPTQTNTWLACKLYLDLGFVPIKENAEQQDGVAHNQDFDGSPGPGRIRAGR
ncbi:MAG: GNAT family N-acetyltransferase, partial [Lachnospiraceae bacterium]